MVLLALTSLLSGIATGSPDCKLSLTSPRHLDGAVAAGQAQPLFRSPYRVTFTFWSAGPTARLQVQFTPGSPVRFSPQEIKETLDAVSAGIEFIQVKDSQVVLKRLAGWEFVGNTAVATFEMPNSVLSRFGKSFLDFGLDLPQAVKDIHPAGSIDTHGCETLGAELLAHPVVAQSLRALHPQLGDLHPAHADHRSAAGPTDARSIGSVLLDTVSGYPIMIGVVVVFLLWLAIRKRSSPSLGSSSYVDYGYGSSTATEAIAPALESETHNGESRDDQDERRDDEQGEEPSDGGADQGEIWEGSSRVGYAAAVFKNGFVYEGHWPANQILGRYDSGQIYRDTGAFAVPIAHFEDGEIYQHPVPLLRAACATCEDGFIWAGKPPFTSLVASYKGDDEGAAAAAVLLGLVSLNVD